MSQDVRFARLASGAALAWTSSGRGLPLLRSAHWMTHVGEDPRSPVWQPWIERLSRHCRYLRYDERGCGLSSPDDTPLGLEASVEELEVVADAAGLQRLALLGLSGGAAAAIAFAARHPQRVSHLVLLGSYTRGLLAREPTDEQRAWVDATARLIELGWGRSGSPVQQFFTATLLPAATPEQVRALNEQQRLSCGPARAAALLRARSSIDVEALLPQVRCPTLVMHVDHDATVPAEAGRTLAASIAGARFLPLPGRNHLPLAGEPAFELFARALEDFVLAPQPTPRAGDAPGAAAAATAFTPRERDLLRLVAAGRDNLQIAAELGLAGKTVRNALSRLYARLQVEGRPQAVVRARELGY